MRCTYCSVLMRDEEYLRLQGCCDTCAARYGINRATDLRTLQCVLCRRLADRIQQVGGVSRVVCSECAEHTHDTASLCPSCGRVCRTCPRALILCSSCRQCQLCTTFHNRASILICCTCDDENHYDCSDCGRAVRYEDNPDDEACELCNSCYGERLEREYQEEERRQARARARAIRAQVKHYCSKCENTISLCFCPVAV